MAQPGWAGPSETCLVWQRDGSSSHFYWPTISATHIISLDVSLSPLFIFLSSPDYRSIALFIVSIFHLSPPFISLHHKSAVANGGTDEQSTTSAPNSNGGGPAGSSAVTSSEGVGSTGSHRDFDLNLPAYSDFWSRFGGGVEDEVRDGVEDEVESPHPVPTNSAK